MTRTLPFYQLDAFTARRFRGNPAAVVPLANAAPDALSAAEMQAVAAENNLSETAYIRRRPGTAAAYDIRWFTPALEVPLCGHATLASAAVVLERLEPAAARVVFHSLSGPLTVDRTALADGSPGYRLDFPRDVPQPLADEALQARAAAALGIEVLGLLSSPTASHRLIALARDAAAVEAAVPDLARVQALPYQSVAPTAAGDGAHADVDFVSRMFAPRAGIAEDPVTGSLHCLLTPYWAARLGRTALRARQLSARRGELTVEDTGRRTLIAGAAVFVIEGRIVI